MNLTHDSIDVEMMHESVVAAIESGFGPVNLDGLNWLETDEGKNHRHILSLWDSYEDADSYEELCGRNPEMAKRFLSEAAYVHQINDENYLKSYASYLYAFELFDYVVESMKKKLTGE